MLINSVVIVMSRYLKEIISIHIIIISILLCSPSVLAKDFIVVIDAGHGGADVGAVGKTAYEKNINLGVALKLGELISDNCSNTKVVYTRKTDRYLTLNERADIANKAHGNLFISIHTNSVDKKNKNRSSISGAATYVLGMHKNDDNLAVAMRENSVMKLEKDFSVTYEGFDPNSSESYIIFEISQNQHVKQSLEFASRIQQEFSTTAGRKNNGVRQAGFWVLARTSMPAVLVELDFICNPTSERFLDSERGQEKLAKSIFNAVKSYKSSFFDGADEKNKLSKPNAAKKEDKSDTDKAAAKKNEKSKSRKTAEKPESKEEELSKSDAQPKAIDDETEVYKIQFLTSPKKLKDGAPEFKGLSPVNYYYENGIYKYTFGIVTDKKEALSLQNKIKKNFKGAFIVVFKGDKRIR